MRGVFFLAVSLLFVGCDSGTRPDGGDTYRTPSEYSVDPGRFINDVVCDIVVEKRTEESKIDICYDYDDKLAHYVYYKLDAAYIDAVNIKERPWFYPEPSIPEAYRAYYSDYSGSGYDRGHIAPDADFDYNAYDLEQVYTMANVIPQDPYVNERLWSDLEAYERNLTRIFGYLNVLTGIVVEDDPPRIGASGIAVPDGFWKILWNAAFEFKACFYYDNYVLRDTTLDRYDLHKVPCDSLLGDVTSTLPNSDR